MTLFLIRHASSGTRNNFDPLDWQRPLDALGRDQAEAIATKLSDGQITRILSSKATRCSQTVTPLAERLGLEIEIVPQLFEGSSSSAAISLIRSFDSSTDTGTETAAAANIVLCSHGDIIPDILRILAVGGTRIHGSGCAKGSIWAVDNSTQRFESAHYFDAQQVLADKTVIL